MKPVLASLALLLAACGTTPPVQFFSLGPQAVADSAPAAAGPSLVVGPVGVPAAIDRLHMVRLVDGVRVEVADGHRWAAPLKTEMARRIASDIARLRGYGRVVAWPQSTLAEPDLSLPIDVQRFDAEGFERVTLEAVWTLRKGGKDLASRRFVGSEPVAAPTYAALAAAHGRLIDALARDIAAALP
jgi:uncharacterized lipoprotein YmbA